MTRFIAIDGEGWDGLYTLLASRHGAIENAKGLKSRTCFDFLLNLAASNRDATFIGFGIGYDVNMMLRDMPDDNIRALLTEDVNETTWDGYRVRYYPKKIFEIRRDGQRFVWYDVFSFYGCSFVSALRKFIPAHPLLEQIAHGKAGRQTFRAEDLPEIRRYNEAELVALEDLVSLLARLFESQGIYLEKWHGPGALASYLIGENGYNLKEDFPRYRESHVPQGLALAWDCAFFGGRIENVLTGTVHDVHSYDINSAYPFAASLMPRHVPARFWRHRETRKLLPHPMALYRVRWNVTGTIGPFPFRDKRGLISFPLGGAGWYYRPELEAALRVFPRGIQILEAWYQEEDAPGKMSRVLPGLYATRKRLKAAHDPAEYVLKLALNSVYGKFAQRKGKPQYRCPAFAGLITSKTRAMLLETGARAEVLAFATDSIFTRDTPDVAQNDELGGWKREDYSNFTCIQNGFYRLDDRFHVKQANRGIPKVDFNKLLDEIERTGRAIVTDRIFVTHQLALAFPHELGRHRLKFVDRKKIIRPFATSKRESPVTNLEHWLTDYSLSKPPRYAPDAESCPIS